MSLKTVKRARPALAYPISLALVAAATVAATIVDQAVHASDLSLVFVLPVVISAAAFGWGPALGAAVAGVLAYNFFLLAPRYTLRVDDPANVWALVLLLTVAAVVSAVAAAARRRAMESREAADQATALHALARGLVGETSAAGVAARCAEALGRLFRAPAVVLVDEGGGLSLTGRAGVDLLSDADLEAARWSLAAGLATRGGVWPGGESTFDFWPVATARRRRAVVGVRIAGPEGRPDAPERRVEIVAGYLAVALDREALAREALDREVLAAGDRFKSDLLAAVSHDLRTPLATILLSLQSLRAFRDSHDPETRDALLAATEAEAARLTRMVENLLDMNRLEAGALPVRPAPARAAALVAAALERAGPALAGRKVVNQARRGETLLVDAGLFESALANLLENAAKYSPEGSTVRIVAGRDDDGLGFVEVLDEGAGFAGSAEPYFEKFRRGRDGDGRAPGTGLGLSIARGFLEAQGGRVEASDRSDRAGARVRLLAPLAGAA